MFKSIFVAKLDNFSKSSFPSEISFFSQIFLLGEHYLFYQNLLCLLQPHAQDSCHLFLNLTYQQNSAKVHLLLSKHFQIDLALCLNDYQILKTNQSSNFHCHLVHLKFVLLVETCHYCDLLGFVSKRILRCFEVEQIRSLGL